MMKPAVILLSGNQELPGSLPCFLLFLLLKIIIRFLSETLFTLFSAVIDFVIIKTIPEAFQTFGAQTVFIALFQFL